ncbi:unnamed protein product, partial [Pocillopora meandrina]
VYQLQDNGRYYGPQARDIARKCHPKVQKPKDNMKIRRNNSESYHLRGTEPFYRRDTFNINTLFFAHRSLSTSLLNSTECFCVPWSWTDHLPRRKASPVASPSAACVTVAALMQYFLMAAFCWMLIEGIYLYLFVVKVYNINTKMYMYHVISWSLPLIMVAISLGIAAGKEGLQSYTSNKHCWLSSTNNLIWIFVSSVAFIEVLNILILVRVIKEMTNLLQPAREEDYSQQIRNVLVLSYVVMIPLLGVTWLFGLFSPVHKGFVYIFTILNSAQGFLIFALQCMRNTQVRKNIKPIINSISSVFSVSIDIRNNSIRKSSQVNPSGVGDVWAVELQSCAAFESNSHLT